MIPSAAESITSRATCQQVGKQVIRGPKLDLIPRQPTATRPLKLYPELCAAALSAGLDKPLALWSILQAINVTGSSSLILPLLITSLTDFGYTPASAYRHLKAQTFWTIERAKGGKPTKVRITSILSVSHQLGLTKVSNPVLVEIEAFRKLKHRRAAMFAAWLSIREGRPISRAAIKSATGIEARQQRRYCQISGTTARRNYAFTEGPSGQLVPWYDHVEGKSQLWQILKRLPNSFDTALTQGHRGMTRKVSRQLKRFCMTAEATFQARRYFDSARAAAHSKHRAAEVFVRVPPGRNPLTRGQAWCVA